MREGEGVNVKKRQVMVEELRKGPTDDLDFLKAQLPFNKWQHVFGQYLSEQIIWN